MISLKKFSFVPLVFALSFPFFSQQTLRAEISAPKTLDLNPTPAFAELNFSTGQSYLDPFARQNIDQMIRDANLRGSIAQVQILSWGDTDPSEKGQTALAASRAKSVEEYIRGRGEGLTIKTYNMAEKPTALEELQNSANTQYNLTLIQAGLANPKAAKPSKVLVLLLTK